MFHAIFFTSSNVRVRTRFKDSKLARLFLDRVQEEFGEFIASTHVVDAKHAEGPPEGFEPRHNAWWCPYCREVRTFVKNHMDDKWCPVCHISDRDFYVRKHNHLWGSTNLKKTPRKRRKQRQEGTSDG